MFTIDDVIASAQEALYKTVPQCAKVVFVSDFFTDQVNGGAELTTEALISSYKGPEEDVFRIRSSDVTIETLQQARPGTLWVFGNWVSLDLELVPWIVENLRYAVIEYDYKFCKYRSPQLHHEATGTPCDCYNWDEPRSHARFVEVFYAKAERTFWMSEAQRNEAFKAMPLLLDQPSTVLSSVFTKETLQNLFTLPKIISGRNGKWLVLNSNSWVKGTKQSLDEANKRGLDHELVGGLSYEELLVKLAHATGLIYLPAGWDTCPRLVIEAKLLGCELIINDNVQHASEDWFNGSETEILEYLAGRASLFWDSFDLSCDDEQKKEPRISGYVTVRNAINQSYPIGRCLATMLTFCDEVVVVDGGSDDRTLELLHNIAATQPEGTVIVKSSPRDWSSSRSAIFDGELKAEARSLCTGDFCWQQDADELVRPSDAGKIRYLASNMGKGVNLIALPVLEWWGSRNKVRLDITPWKWRLSKNDPDLTHGIPRQLRRTDELGLTYAAQGTDGCDMISRSTGDPVQFLSFYGREADELRTRALQGQTLAIDSYTRWLAAVCEALPIVVHESWLDIKRKIILYRDFWSRHWDALYDRSRLGILPDERSNNFFDVPWSQVTDEMIERKAEQLEKLTGGWVFHTPWNGGCTPHVDPGALNLLRDGDQWTFGVEATGYPSVSPEGFFKAPQGIDTGNLLDEHDPDCTQRLKDRIGART